MSYEINPPQLELFPLSETDGRQNQTSTFSDNMSMPIHRWFRYTAGFSAAWVRSLIEQEKGKRVLDPFAGSGTVMLESAFAGVESIGIEAQPYVYRIANAKLSWQLNPVEFKKSAKRLLETAKAHQIHSAEFPELIQKCFPEDTLSKLSALKQAWLNSEDDPQLMELNWFVITAILRVTSPVGTAQWQYVLPNKAKSKVIDPFIAFEIKVSEMALDMINMQRKYPFAPSAKLLMEDARAMPSVPDHWADLVITSPPYANNYDYADATRLEMTFWGDVSGWGQLQEKVRQYLITACTQQVSKFQGDSALMLDSHLLYPIQEEIKSIFNQLSEVRLTKGGKKNYHLMILGYFTDLAQVFLELRRVTKPGGKVCFVVGDSAPYGVYVPVDKWLGELALNAGFQDYRFEKLRDRNIKWKNRKHQVPLHEGRIWITA